jgi:hypothetical protein
MHAYKLIVSPVSKEKKSSEKIRFSRIQKKKEGLRLTIIHEI